MRTAPRSHYVRHNAVTRVPRSYIYLDTEARREVDGRVETQTFRFAVAAHDARRKDRDGWRERQWIETDDQRALWEWITDRCARRTRTVLVAHNLAYDLRIADAFTWLPALGWKFQAGRVDDGGAWFIWTNEGRTLAMVDTLSWTPAPLERLGELVEIPKLPLPAWEDTDDVWMARCRRDVEILSVVWRRLMRWISDDDLGNWKLSGAGQSWAAFRHRFMDHALLVHEDEEARRAERRAAHTGRCEAWEHGELTCGPFTEWDFQCAYARIGAECLVPTQLCGEMRNPNVVTVLAAAMSRAVLAEIEVTTDEPILPFRSEDGILWPVGTFRTVAWDTEIQLAVDSGADVAVRRAWVYRRAPALRAFCAYVLSGLDGSRGESDPVVLVALKHWSRALIGRTAAQWGKWEPWGLSPHTDVALGPAYHREPDERFQLMQLGNQLIRQTGTLENPDAMVAIMSWVMAESRVRLWKAMQTAGIANVVYTDTDSLIVTEAGSQRLQAAAIDGLRVKGRWSSLKVLGPRQIVPGGQLRASGVPRGAVQVGDTTWEAGTWSGLATSLRTGRADSVEIASRRYELRGVDRRRGHNPDGSTFALDAAGLTELVAAIPA